MKFRALLATIATSLLLSSCASTGSNAATSTINYRVPANDYSTINCEQMTDLIITAVTLHNQGMPLEKVYETITPKNASIRVQLVHMIAIPGFYTALGHTSIKPSDLKDLESICLDTGILESVVITNQIACSTLDEISPLIKGLEKTGLSLQTAAKQTNRLMSKIPLPLPSTQKFFVTMLPNLVDNYVAAIYSYPEVSSDQFLQQCLIESTTDEIEGY